jgi:phage terminase small subunit
MHSFLMDFNRQQLMKRTDEGFRYPVCEKHFALTNSYRQHLAREGLSATIPRTRKVSDNPNKQPAKRQRFSVSNVILVSCGWIRNR